MSMGFGNASVDEGFYAGAAVDLRGKAGHIVVRGTTANNKAVVALATAESALALGVIKEVDLGSLGQAVTVCCQGKTQVRLGATFTPGTDSGFFKSDADGKAVPAAAGEAFVGRLLFTETSATLTAGGLAWAIIGPSNGDGA